MIVERDPLRPSNQRHGKRVWYVGYGCGYGGIHPLGGRTPGDIGIRVCYLSLHRIFKEHVRDLPWRGISPR